MSHRLRAHTPRGTRLHCLCRVPSSAPLFFPLGLFFGFGREALFFFSFCPFMFPICPVFFLAPFCCPVLGYIYFSVPFCSVPTPIPLSLLFFFFLFVSVLFFFSISFFILCVFFVFFCCFFAIFFSRLPFFFALFRPFFFWAFFSGPLLLFPASPLSSDDLKKLSYML